MNVRGVTRSVRMCPAGMKRNPAWIETFSVQFLGSVEVPYHQGNGILCAAMQKVSWAENSRTHHMTAYKNHTGAVLHTPLNHIYFDVEIFSVRQIAISRKRTVHVRPPSLCELEISLQGVKLIMSLEDEFDTLDEVWTDKWNQSINSKSIGRLRWDNTQANFLSLSSRPSLRLQYDRCSHFFQMKNISFCGCHPRNNW